MFHCITLLNCSILKRSNKNGMKIILNSSFCKSVKKPTLTDLVMSTNSTSRQLREPRVLQFAYVNSSKMQNLIKSECDPMEYRLIELDNGLRALLVSDVNNIIELDNVKDNSSDECMSSGSEKSFDDEEYEFSFEEEDVLSRVSGKTIEEKMAACALCVGVGSFSDPPEVPGLAHFLEHMVFMGSEKHPQENGFDEFIKKHGGSDNGSTDCEITSFYLECNEKYLSEGMDRFAQFFISPLMKKEAMTREREIIQSEFDMALSSDESRRWQILASLAPPGHPAEKFSWGNLITLRDNIDDEVLYEKVHEFKNRYYSAHRMTVAVQARLPLDILESYVRESFSSVPCTRLPNDDFKEFIGTYGKPDIFNKLLWVKPIKDICQIHLTWVLPSYVHEYKSRPLDYLGWLIEHEGEGSLLSFLSQKVWALECSAGNEESGFAHNSIYSLFSVSLVITEEGFLNLKEVIAAVFRYLAMLKENCPNKAIYDELESISRTNFRYKTEIPSAQYVEILAESMHIYEPEHYIAGGELYLEYKPELITEIINYLSPETVNIIVYSKTKDDNFYDKVEPWFQTLYKIVDIPSDWMMAWKNCKLCSDFHIPDPNPYLTTDFTILEKPEINPPYPEKILDDEIMEIWYRQDTKFNRPLAYYSFHVISPLTKMSPLNAAMLDVLTSYFDIKFVGKIYPANEGELYYTNLPSELGLLLQFSGYNQKLPLLFDEVMQLISKHITEINDECNRNLLKAVIKEKSRYHFNRLLKTDKLIKWARLSLLVENFWTSLERLEQMENITLDNLQEFAKQFFSHVRVLGLIQGNISKKNALELCHKLPEVLGLMPLKEPRPVMRVAKLEKGEKYFRFKSFNDNDSNSVITNYYQVGPSTIRNSCIIDLIILLMEEPLFDTLRTKQQIGYDVSCLLRDTFGILGFSVTIYFQSYKFDPDEVDIRIEKFLANFLNTLKSASKAEIEETKKSLCAIKSGADLQLNDEVKRNFTEICANEYIFDRLQREVKMIPEITHEEICTWFENHVAYGKDFRKLSVQVIGSPKINENESKSCVEKNDLTLAVLESSGSKMENFILDIEEYKSKREYYEITRNAESST